MFLGIFFGKCLEGKKKCRTFAPAFAQKRQHTKKEFFERFTQTEVVQEARAEMLLGKRTNRFNFLRGRASNLSEKKSWIVVLRQIYTPILYRSETKQIFYSEEFDPGSG